MSKTSWLCGTVLAAMLLAGAAVQADDDSRPPDRSTPQPRSERWHNHQGDQQPHVPERYDLRRDRQRYEPYYDRDYRPGSVGHPGGRPYPYYGGYPYYRHGGYRYGLRPSHRDNDYGRHFGYPGFPFVFWFDAY